MAVVSQEPWAVQIREAYGDIQEFSRRFGVKAERYCYENARRAVESELAPFSRIIGAYGKKAVESFIGVHIAEAVARMGEVDCMDSEDVRNTAEGICECIPARFLTFTSVVGFFHALRGGQWEIYGKLTPFKIMEAFRKYVTMRREEEIKFAHEKEQREEKEALANRKNVINWQQWARLHNIKDTDILSYQARLRREDLARWNALGMLGDVVGTLGEVFQRLISLAPAVLSKVS